MATEYFRRSMAIKGEVESDEDLIQTIKETFYTLPEGRLLGQGTSNRIYRIGETTSGLFLALRIPLKGPKDQGYKDWAGRRIKHYEKFCQIPEFVATTDTGYQNLGFRPVDFCIGVVCDTEVKDMRPKVAGIILEDVTRGGKYRLVECHNNGHNVIRYDGSEHVDKVMVDLEGMADSPMLEGLELEESRYFTESNRLNLK